MSFFRKREGAPAGQRANDGSDTPAQGGSIRSATADAKTVVVSRTPMPPQRRPAPEYKQDEKTRLVGSQSAARGPGGSNSSQDDGMADPVVGWLVIVEGKGKGSFRKIGLGANPLGRDKGQRIVLDTGDDQISRAHAVVTYDPRSRRYFVSPGEGANLSYVGGEPVLAPRELKAGEGLTVGSTVLRFVPFCGPDFNWS